MRRNSLWRSIFIILWTCHVFDFHKVEQDSQIWMPTMWLFLGFSAFFLWSHLRNYEKKKLSNKLRFWEASRNHKWSICWKFQLSISLGTQKESHCRHPYLRILFPFMTRRSNRFWSVTIPTKVPDLILEGILIFPQKNLKYILCFMFYS